MKPLCVCLSSPVLQIAIAAPLLLNPAAIFAAQPAGTPGSFVSTPPDMTYYAREGDTLSAIAKQFTDKTQNWIPIGQRNHIQDDRRIPIGTAILIPLDLLPEEPSEARVVALAGTPAFRNPGAEDSMLSIGAVLREGAEIHTGKNGFVTLALPDDSRIAIPSNSDLRLSRLKKTRYTNSPRTELSLLSGKVESRVSSLTGNRGRFEVRSPLAIAGVRGTRFRVGILDGATATEVLEGGVTVDQSQHSRKEKIVPAGQGNLVDAKGVGLPLALLPAPQPDAAGSLQLRPTMSFQATPVPGAVSYHAQITRDEQALDVLMEKSSAEPRFKFDGLDDGRYVLRVSAIDKHGLEGIPATQSFSLEARPEPPFTTEPKNKIRSEQVSFVWTEAAKASAYHLQIARDKQFSNLVSDQASLHDTQWQSQVLPEGHYFWRIATVVTQNGKAKQGPYSDVQEFSRLAAQGPASFQDSNGKNISFSWAGETGQVFLLQIARDAEFKQLYLNKELQESRIEIPRPAAGSYYIRVRATDPDGYVGQFSATQKVTITTRWVTTDGDAVMSGEGALKTGF